MPSPFGQQNFLLDPEPTFSALAQIPQQTPDWVWPGWLARRHLHTFHGIAGSGRTAVLLMFARTVSSGSLWPDGETCVQAPVLFWSSGDSLNESLSVRAAAQGADEQRLFIRGNQPFNPARDIPELGARMGAIPGLALVLIDAIEEPKASSKRTDVKVERAQLERLAQSHNAAIVITLTDGR